MDFQAYDPSTETQNLTSLMLQMRELIKPENAFTTLPADTTFAIVAALLERDANDSFWTTTLSSGNSIGSAAVNIGADNGYEGRFNGYVAIAGNKFRVYKDGQLHVEDDIANVSVYLHQAEYVIQTSTKKFKVTDALIIPRAEGRFTSRASGLNSGLNPLFDILAANGASVKRASGKMQLVYLLVVLAFIGGVFVLIFKK